MEIYKVSAFSLNNQGGNPANVVLCDQFPLDTDMLSIEYREKLDLLIGRAHTQLHTSCH